MNALYQKIEHKFNASFPLHFAIDIIERLNGINMVDGVTSHSAIGVFRDLVLAKTSGNITFQGTPVSENSNAVIDNAETAKIKQDNFYANLENNVPKIDNLV